MGFVYAILVVVAVLAALAWWQRQSLLRALGAGGPQEGSRRLTGQTDARALFEEAADDHLAHIRQAKEALEGCRAMLASVQRQVESGQREKTRLESRIAAALEQNAASPEAKEYALQLAEVERQLALNREQLAQHQQTCGGFAEQVEIGQKRLLETRRRMDALGMALEQSQRERELAEMASTLNSEEVRGRIEVAEETLHREIDKNRAAGRVAADLAEGGGPEETDDAQRECEAGKILERFRKTTASNPISK